MDTLLLQCGERLRTVLQSLAGLMQVHAAYATSYDDKTRYCKVVEEVPKTGAAERTHQFDTCALVGKGASSL